MLQATLIYRSRDGSERQFAVDKTVMLIGRHQKCDLKLDRQSVSRRHCVLIRNAEQVVVRDMGSRNGTRVNGDLLDPNTEVPLHNGDSIEVGKLAFHILIHDPNAEPNVSAASTNVGGSVSAADILAELDDLANDVLQTAHPASAARRPGPQRSKTAAPTNDAAPIDLESELLDSADSNSAATVSAVETTISETVPGEHDSSAAEPKGDDESEDELESTNGPKRLPDHLRPKAPATSRDAAEQTLKRFFGR